MIVSVLLSIQYTVLLSAPGSGWFVSLASTVDPPMPFPEAAMIWPLRLVQYTMPPFAVT